MNTYVHTKACTSIFITDLFVIAKHQVQSPCPTTDEWLNFGAYRGTLLSDEKEQIIDTWKNLDESPGTMPS